MPEWPHRKAAVAEFLSKLPDDPAEREKALRYMIVRIPNNPLDMREGLAFPAYLLSYPDRREALLRQMVDPDDASEEELTSSARGAIPRFILDAGVVRNADGTMNPIGTLPPEERRKLRLELRDDLVRFMQFLSRDDLAQGAVGLLAGSAISNELRFMLFADTDDAVKIRYVLGHFGEISNEDRARAAKFLIELPRDRQERQQIIDYMAVWGADPRQLYARGNPVFSLWFHISSPEGLWIGHICILIVMAMFTIGLYTRTTAVISWIAMLSYIQRSPQILFGMDTMMNIAMVYLMIGNSGAAFSVDRLLARRRVLRNILQRDGQPTPQEAAFLQAPPRSVSANFAIRLMQMHFCIMYMSAGLSKLKGTTWWDHNATWWTLANPEFSPILFPWFKDILIFLAEHRPIFALAMGSVVVFTLLLEICFPCLVWTHVRPWMVFGGVLLHTGIGLTMGLSIFSLFMMTLLLAFFPPQTVRERLSWTPVPPEEKLKIVYNPAQPAEVRSVAWLGALDVAEQIEWKADSTKPHDGIRVALADGKTLSGSDATNSLIDRLKLLRSVWLLLLIPGVPYLLRRCFRGGRG